MTGFVLKKALIMDESDNAGSRQDKNYDTKVHFSTAQRRDAQDKKPTNSGEVVVGLESVIDDSRRSVQQNENQGSASNWNQVSDSSVQKMYVSEIAKVGNVSYEIEMGGILVRDVLGLRVTQT